MPTRAMDTTAPDAPTGVTIDVSQTRVQVFWDSIEESDVSDTDALAETEEEVAFFQVQLADDVGFTNILRFDRKVLAHQKTFRVHKPGTRTFYARVRAVDSLGNRSDWASSDDTIATVTAPTDFCINFRNQGRSDMLKARITVENVAFSDEDISRYQFQLIEAEFTNLTAGINSTDTPISVADFDNEEVPMNPSTDSPDFSAWIEDEELLVTSISGANDLQWHVTRGYNGTTNVAHANGKRVWYFGERTSNEFVEDVDGSAATTTSVVRNCTPGFLYQARVRAIDKQNRRSAWTPWSPRINAQHLAEKCVDGVEDVVSDPPDIGGPGPSGPIGVTGPTGPQGVSGADGGIAIRYNFSTTTTDSDPGSGNLRLSNATQNASTTIRADVLDYLGVDYTSLLDTFDDSTNTIKGTITLAGVVDPTDLIVFDVTALASPSGYKNITVTPIQWSEASPFADGDDVNLTFSRAGDIGVSGVPGTTGAQGVTGVSGVDGGIAIRYTFSTTTTDIDPGNGFLRLNNATQNAATTIRADLLDVFGTDWATLLDTFDDSTNTIKGTIRLQYPDVSTDYLAFNVTALATPSGYRNITVTNIGASSSSPFANNDDIVLTFARSGDAGVSGVPGTTGTQGPTGVGTTGPPGPTGTTGVTGAQGGISIQYQFSTTTTDSDPGSGFLRLNNATQNLATVIRTDLLEYLSGADYTTVLDTFNDGNYVIKGAIRLFKTSDPTKWITFNVTALASPTGYKNITAVVTGSSSANPFANNDIITLYFQEALASDGVAPASSPTPTIEGGVGFIVANWTVVANADPVEYEIHVSLTTGFTPDGTTLVGEITGTMFFIRTMPDDEPLAYDTDYFVRIIAKDIDGAAAAGTEASGRMVPINSPDINTDAIVSRHILAGEVMSEALNSQFVIGGTIKTSADPIQRVEISGADGIVLFAADGITPLVNLPTTAGKAASFAGSVEADDLTVHDMAVYEGSGKLTGNGTLGPQVGVSDPVSSPTLYNYIETLSFNTSASSTDRRGLYYNDTDWYHLGGDRNVWRVNASGVALDSVTASAPTTEWTHRAICYSPNTSRWYVLSRKDSGAQRVFIYANGANSLPSTRLDELQLNGTTFDDGTAMAYEKATGKLWIMTTNNTNGVAYRYALSGNSITFEASVTLDASGSDFNSGCNTLYVGTGDFGATRIVANAPSSSTYRVWNTSGTYQASETWLVASIQGGGLEYDTDLGRFCELLDSGPSLYRFHTWTESSSPSANKYQVAYSWTDTDATGGTHESELSPRTAHSHYSRRGVYVSWPTIPDGGGTDDPNAVTVYTLDSDTDPGTAHASYKDQGTKTGTGYSAATAFSTATAGTKDTAFLPETPGTGPYAPLQANGDGFLPVGTIAMWGTPTPPTGWLICDGSSQLISSYAILSSIIRGTWGGADGTHFDLPSFEGRFPIGKSDAGTGSTLAGTGGTIDHTHDGHASAVGDHNVTANSPTTGGANRVTQGNHTGTHSAINPPFLAIHFIIKT